MKESSLFFLRSIWWSLLTIRCFGAQIAEEVQATKEPIILNEIQPFAPPFSHVPEYFFKQASCHLVLDWKPEEFEARKAYAAKVTSEKITQHIQKLPLDKQGEKANILIVGYSWIDGLNFLETLLRRGRISFADSLALNDRFSRFAHTPNGRLREHHMSWRKRNFTETDFVLYNYLLRTPGSIDFEDLESDKVHEKAFCKTSLEIMSGNDRYLDVKGGDRISTDSIRRLLTILSESKEIQLVDSDQKVLKIDLSEVDAWEQEDQKAPDHVPGFVSAQRWVSNRLHVFPAPEEIGPRLILALEKAKLETVHPIERAATVLWTILQTYCWSEANIATGRGIAAGILLMNGYLPPVISAEDEMRVEYFIQHLSSERGYQEFLQLFAQRIIDAQETHRGQVL